MFCSGDVIVEPYLITLNEGAMPYTSFAHGGVEFIYMLEGEVDYRHGGEVYRLTPAMRCCSTRPRSMDPSG